MRHTLPLTPQFYVTAPQPCPYLEGRMERKLFTALQGDTAQELNDTLSHQGFRRSQNVIYRPSCADCALCFSARVRVADFSPSKSQRRIARKNAHLKRDGTAPWATEEQYDLFRRYLAARHHSGGMADMDIFEFAAMIEETPVRSRIVEYRQENGDLAAVCLTDVLTDGLSMVYSFFEPDLAAASLGSYIILDHIEIARHANMPFVYLGYWVPGSPKMDYKARFRPIEIFRGGRWSDLQDAKALGESRHPLANDPIADQVAAIHLPGPDPTTEPKD